MNDAKKKAIDDAKGSLDRLTKVNATDFARPALGEDLNFEPAVPYIQKNLDLFRQISSELLPEMSTQKLAQLKQTADAEWNKLEQIKNFSVGGTPNPKNARDGLITQLDTSYDGLFEALWPMIAYSVRRATDFERLEREARASMQSAADQAARIMAEIEASKKAAEQALEAIRKVAEEQGVSQQAGYFQEEAETHSKEAAKWLKRTEMLTAGLFVYSVLALFVHKWSVLAPSNTYESVQLSVGKALVFITIASYLLMSARNYTANRHNMIVNRHRRNSLVTYRALVEAAGDKANRDIVLTQASESIFGPQVTGFSKNEAHDGSALSMVNVGASLAKHNGG